MPKETFSVQVYPDDRVVNRTIAEYERFGWEVISNQRMQEFTGQTSYSDGSSEKHYSTFNKITFSRDKDAAWYEEVKAYETNYRQLEKEAKRLQESMPSDTYSGDPIAFPKLSLILFFTPLFLVPIILIIRFCVRKSKDKKRAAEWEQTQKGKVLEQIAKIRGEIGEKQAEMQALVAKAEIAMKTKR